MNVELKVPEIGESITEVEIGEWLKKAGEAVGKDEPVVTLESEKATVELPAPEAGKVVQVLKQKGEVAKIGEVIAYIEKDGQGEPATKREVKGAPAQPKPKEAEKVQPSRSAAKPAEKPAQEERKSDPAVAKPSPSARADGAQKKEVPEQPTPDHDEVRSPAATKPEPVPPPPPEPPAPEGAVQTADREEEVVPMSRLRRTVAERLVSAQHNAALLTTFNEIDMGAVVALRKEHGEAFQKKYDAKLGFMSFFAKAAIDALKQFPVVNAEVRETNIIYHNYFDIGIAVGGGKGLAVPVLRNAERMSFAEIETAIADFARRAKDNKLKVEELQGGTFTISNGGVYGSLLSTPIVNPPQTGVLGLHSIQDRPVAREGNVVVRPMMYVALSYDHRIVDGREAVLFLKRIKEVIENPARMLMEV